jgi:hypothetical protein
MLKRRNRNSQIADGAGFMMEIWIHGFMDDSWPHVAGSN